MTVVMEKPAGYEDMEWEALKGLAHQRGLALGPGRTRKVLIKELRNLDEGVGQVQANRKKGGRPKRTGPTEAELHTQAAKRGEIPPEEPSTIVDAAPEVAEKQALAKGPRTPETRGQAAQPKREPNLRLVGLNSFRLGRQTDNVVEIHDANGNKVANFFRVGNPMDKKHPQVMPYLKYAEVAARALEEEFGD
jgi:hypothetical protein